MIFNSPVEFMSLFYSLMKYCTKNHFASLMEFKNLPIDNFCDMNAYIRLMTLLENLWIKTLLDVDGCFVMAPIFTKCSNDITEIDCIYDGNFIPIKESIFHNVYKNFSECSLRHYNAALISENTPEDFDTACHRLMDTAEIVITFARNGSELAKYIQDAKNNFKKVDVYPCSPSGQWIFCYLKTPPQDFAMYVVTHKLLPPEHIKTFPDKYTIINAGAAIREDLGYLRDDSGENISDLNLYLNEVTAFYWVWKNTSHTAVGFCHYRRFFQLNANGSFLTKEEALKLLEDYDVLIRPICRNGSTFLDTMYGFGSNEEELIKNIKEIIRKNLKRGHPDYLDAFDYKMNSSMTYFNNSFVMRKNVFDAYCEWLFSFMLDSMREILDKTSLSETKDNSKRKVGYFCEAMVIVWLMKNHLRVKEIRYVNKDPFKV